MPVTNVKHIIQIYVRKTITNIININRLLNLLFILILCRHIILYFLINSYIE